MARHSGWHKKTKMNRNACTELGWSEWAPEGQIFARISFVLMDAITNLSTMHTSVIIITMNSASPKWGRHCLMMLFMWSCCIVFAGVTVDSGRTAEGWDDWQPGRATLGTSPSSGSGALRTLSPNFLLGGTLSVSSPSSSSSWITNAGGLSVGGGQDIAGWNGQFMHHLSLQCTWSHFLGSLLGWCVEPSGICQKTLNFNLECQTYMSHIWLLDEVCHSGILPHTIWGKLAGCFTISKSIFKLTIAYKKNPNTLSHVLVSDTR